MLLMIVLGLDDIHPEKAADGTDCGGDMDGGVLGKLFGLMEEFRSLRATLFVTPDWMYLPQPDWRRGLSKFLGINLESKSWPEGRFRLDNFPEWCSWLDSKMHEGSVSLALHGLHHFQNMYSYSAEFACLSEEEAAGRIKLAEMIVGRSRLVFTKVFRPPGWGSNQALMKVLKHAGYAIAGSSGVHDRVSSGVCSSGGIRGTNLLRPQVADGVMNVPANCSILAGKERVDELIAAGGHVVLHGHIDSVYHGEKVENGFPMAVENLRTLLSHMEKNHPEQKFGSFADIVKEGRSVQ